VRWLRSRQEANGSGVDPSAGPIRERRGELEQHPELLEEILQAGAEKARKVDNRPWSKLEKAMKLEGS